MNLEQYQEGVKNLAARVTGQITDAAMIPAASALLAKIKNRIINEGRDSQGAMIGSYSTKAAYFTKKQFVKKGAFKGIGQRGFKGERIVSTREYRAVKQKNGKERLVSEKKYKVVKKTPKSMYLGGGYKELRSIQGRETSFVNLEYSGDTMLSFQMQKGAYNNVLIGFTREKAGKIRRFLEDSKYKKKIFTGTSDELLTYSAEVVKVVGDLTRQILTA